MKKRIISVFFAAVVCITMVGCGKKADSPAQNENKTVQTESNNEDSKGKKMRFDEMGLGISLPEAWAKYEGKNISVVVCGDQGYIVGEIIYDFVSTEDVDKLMEKSKNAKTEEDQKKLAEEYMSKLKKLCSIAVLDKSKEDRKVKGELFSKYTKQDKITEQGNLEYYLLYNEKYDENGLSDRGKKEYKEVYENIKEFKNTIKAYKPISEEEKMNKYKNLEFKTKTLDGKEIDSSFFKDYKLTMVNIWATYCGPCIGEMKDIQKLYEEVKQEKVNVIGIVADTPDDENEELAKRILKEKGAAFTNIIPDEKLLNGLLKDISGVPTTIFVDSNGNIIGKFIVGSRGTEEYKKEIQDRLKNLK